MGLRLLVVCGVSVCVCRVGRRQVLSKSLATPVGPLLSRYGQGLPVRGGPALLPESVSLVVCLVEVTSNPCGAPAV